MIELLRDAEDSPSASRSARRSELPWPSSAGTSRTMTADWPNAYEAETLKLYRCSGKTVCGFGIELDNLRD